ncbi:MBL fold metallo-hydrolase [Candidatus Curtissbacteria bacterium]|nr:MBL fold metallo-hydrolase [Candidatus Curtissbacteria bacterium]
MVDIWWWGQACFRVKGKNTAVVFDPYDPNFTGLPKFKAEADIVCISHSHQDHNFAEAVTSDSGNPFVISGPGEYEKSGVNIVGIASFHDDEEGAKRGKNTIYNMAIDGVNVVHLGDFGQKKLTQEQVEQLSNCDVLLIPVGSVYTISGKEAGDIIAQIEPKIIVPMHYKIDGLKFDLDPVSVFLSAMGKEKLEPQAKLSISFERLPSEPEVVLLQKQ